MVDHSDHNCKLYFMKLFIWWSLFLIGSVKAQWFQNDELETKMVRGPGYEEHRISQPDPSLLSTPPRWLVVGGRKVVPGSVYRVVVEALRLGIPGEDGPITFRAAITHDYQQVSFGKALVQPGDLANILLRVPDTSVFGVWQLRIEGYEGTGHLPLFKNTTLLQFSPKFLTILIQTSRPVYNAGQTVRFRAVMLTRELKPYEGPVDCYVLDPRNRIMRRWPSRQTGDGVVNLQFDLPEYPLLGNWTVQVQVRQQVQNKTILVEQYFKPRFEVFIRLPHTFNVMDSDITGVVVANMTNWRNVYGNCSIKLEIATNSDFPVPTIFETVYEEYVPGFKGFYGFSLPMASVADRAGSLKDVVVRVHASVTDAFGWTTQRGWALARIVQDEAKLQFLGDQPLFFRPGMPVTVHIFVSYADDHPFPEEELEDALLTISFSSIKAQALKQLSDQYNILHASLQCIAQTILNVGDLSVPSFTPGHAQLRSEFMEINGTEILEGEGVVTSTFNVPEQAQTLEVSARFSSSSGLTAGATLLGITSHSPRNRHLQIDTSTDIAVPGQNMIFHVRNDFFINFFNYMVVANGFVIYSGREYINDINIPTITTFSLPASPDMSPVAKIIVWVIDQDKEVVAHSLAIPVNPLGRHEVGVQWNEHKDHTGGSVEITSEGEKGSYFSYSAIWEETYKMDAGNNLDKTRVLLQMMGLHDHHKEEKRTYEEIKEISYEAIPHIRRASTRSRDGFGSNVRFFPTTIAGPDAPTTFNFSELILFTDAMVYYHPSKTTGAMLCNNVGVDGPILLQCLTGSCYTFEQRCDGTPDCPDSSDEAGCPVNVDPFREFRLHRLSRLDRFYDSIDGDWAWRDVRRIGGEVQVFSIPKIPQNWVLSMFAVGKKLGFGIMENDIQFDSAGPFMLTIDAPPVARMWEQVGLTVGIFNFHIGMVAVMVTLQASEDYQTIMVENNGVVNSYDPRRGEGTFQHLLWVPAGESIDVHIPVIFSRMGEIEITVEGSTQMMRDSQTVVIEVVQEGAIIGSHACVLLDLKDRALVYEFMDLPLDETPIIPYTLKRRYIFGTPQAHVSVTGDIVGPAFSEIPENEGNLLGFGVMGAETAAFNFATNIWSLHYLRLTNLITEERIYEVLTAANVYYADLSRYQSESGGFFNWIGSEESVWLTAYALKNLWIANFQDWENHIFIDHSIIQSGVEFLLEYQTAYGSFQETPYYLHPLDSKVDPRARNSETLEYQNISLTAHVVIALQSVSTGLEGDLHRRANLAKQRAVIYLERILSRLTDPYDLALTAWALTTADSGEKDLAYSYLDRMKEVRGDMVYWSREPIDNIAVIYEDSQRPYLQPKGDNKWDAHAVETTAYALLVYIKREGIGIVQENIVRFLASMRELDGGLIASIDSLAAKEALIEYSYRARIRDITDMKVSIECSADQNVSFELALENTLDLSEIKAFDIEKVYGHVSVVGRGAGQALLQLDYSYAVDVVEEIEYPPVPSFEVNVTSRYTGRNNSLITIKSCQSWINTEETEVSGLAVVQIHLPSGYHIMQDALIEMVEKRNVRNLRWAYVTSTDVKFFFTRLEEEPICFSYRVERWFPVSNHTRFSQVRVYELFQPERFEMQLYETYPLYSLDICEVCGSFQCPYCPFYSYSPKLRSQGTILMLSILLSLFQSLR